MIQSIYASVSNADVVPCGKKGKPVSSEPVYLLKNKYLGEYRTELEKAKVRKNLGIADNVVLEWGNITGFIEDNADLKEAFSYKLPDHLKDIIQEDFTTVKGALNWALEYISTFVSDTNSISWLREQVTTLQTKINNVEQNLEQDQSDIETLQTSMQQISEQLTQLSEKLLNIDVDANILNWIKNASSDTIQLKEDSKLEVKISETENNAVSADSTGLYVQDLSKEVQDATEDIKTLQTDVKNVLDTYVTKEQLGGSDFNFVNKNTFEQHVSSADNKFNQITQDLAKTVKTGEDGHVDTLYVNKISKNNDDGNIVITDSFEMGSNIPLDVRFVRKTLEELYALPAEVCYPGMGVIVSSLSSLYILREPAEGTQINQEYIQEPNNWKCPEDLITVALTRQEYEDLEVINPYVFYYIYEDEITRTQEPKREQYLTEEEFLAEWQKWTDSLKTLSQEYMSASWGVDIENKLGKKADSETVNKLAQEISDIKGNGEGPSLESLNTSIQELQVKDSELKESLDEILTKQEDGEQGRLVDAENEISSIKEDLSNYVTKDYIQNSENNFIFVKKDEYLEDQNTFKDQLSKEINTEKVVTDTISINGKEISVKDDRINYEEHSLAYKEEIPVLETMSQSDYDNLQEINESTYYFTYDSEEILITKTELSKEVQKLQDQIDLLLARIVALETAQGS